MARAPAPSFQAAVDSYCRFVPSHESRGEGGPNGPGTTTLFRKIVGEEAPDEVKATRDGEGRCAAGLRLLPQP
jgi:ABC-type multidrug transport system ATPase subunit